MAFLTFGPKMKRLWRKNPSLLWCSQTSLISLFFLGVLTDYISCRHLTTLRQFWLMTLQEDNPSSRKKTPLGQMDGLWHWIFMFINSFRKKNKQNSANYTRNFIPKDVTSGMRCYMNENQCHIWSITTWGKLHILYGNVCNWW